ncbi:MAG: hypothetical protein V4664_04105 [Patescibacteria group bacterium]
MKEILDLSIEAQIISLLKGGSLSAISLIEKIQSVRLNTPKQSVYLAIRKLKAKEIVVLHKKMVSLHQVWISKMRDFFAEAGAATSDSKEISPSRLQEKEYITYKFNSLQSLDMFWGHTFTLLMGTLTAGNSVFLYNPHQWFLIARKQSELNIIKDAKRRGVLWVQLIAGKKLLDVEVKKHFDGKQAKCHLLGEDVFDKSYYVNCFGDFLIEVWLDNKAVIEIENIYSNYKVINDEVVRLLQNIIEKKGFAHKMKISKNISKTVKIKSLFKKYFLIAEDF